jgi:hypothetical protein
MVIQGKALVNRRDIVAGIAAIAAGCLFGESAVAHAANEQTLEDFLGAEIFQKIADADAALQTSGRFNLSPLARADLTKFALSNSIAMPVRLPTKADLDIASMLYFQCEHFRGQHGKVAVLDDAAFLMKKDLPSI